MATLVVPDYGGMRSMIRKVAFVMLMVAALVLQGFLAYYINTDTHVTASDREGFNQAGLTVMVLLALAGAAAISMRSAWRLLLIAATCLAMGALAHLIFGSVTSPNQAGLTAVGGSVSLLAALFTDMLHSRRAAANGNASRA